MSTDTISGLLGRQESHGTTIQLDRNAFLWSAGPFFAVSMALFLICSRRFLLRLSNTHRIFFQKESNDTSENRIEHFDILMEAYLRDSVLQFWDATSKMIFFKFILDTNATNSRNMVFQ